MHMVQVFRYCGCGGTHHISFKLTFAGHEKEDKINQVEHHARPRRASATAPPRTGADMCKTGAGAGGVLARKKNGIAGGATTSGWPRRTKQDSAGWPTPARTGPAGVHRRWHTKQHHHINSQTLRFHAQGDDSPGRQQGGGGSGQDSMRPSHM